MAGVFRVPWWAALAGSCLLALVSLTLHRVEYARYAQTNNTLAQSALFLSGALNATVAATAAYLLGRGVGWFWGV
jgi:hypothetical protein